MSLERVLQKYRKFSFSERNKGDRFERLMQMFLQNVSWYAGKFKHVWLWKDFPYKGETLKGQDTGIDLVAQTVEDEYWAIQCKCYDECTHLDKKHIDSFLSTSGKTFKDDKNKTNSFSQRMWISTTNNWGANAENAIYGQKPPVIRLSLSDLQNAPVDWEELDRGTKGKGVQIAKNKLRDYQQDAVNKFHEHFKKENRGKLIMACGTGKTFTSLKIAENETKGKGIVLFLAPSIALVGQTLRAWLSQSDYSIFPICICSDPEVSKDERRCDDESLDGYKVVDLAWPASTKPEFIKRQFDIASKYHKEKLIVVFSTYQSIKKIETTQKNIKKIFDLIICDEAHRTTGIVLKDEIETSFTRVHKDKYIKAKRRLYMTATPRLYSDESKKKADEADAYLCSMDDEEMYGPEVFRIGFGEAVDRKCLSDYKVLVLTLSEKDISTTLQNNIADRDKEINYDDASKLIGCINALSKKLLTDEGLLKATDPSPMRKAVAFCQTIIKSRRITRVFNEFKDNYYKDLPKKERDTTVSVEANHIDGKMGSSERDRLLEWLKASPSDGNQCRILTNVRCLSEGVDVPSLDAVLFLSARNSQIDVVQSVGRVMRTAPGKEYGYIIIPVLVDPKGKPEKTLKESKAFGVVRTVLNALRAHDDRFDAMVSKIELNKNKSKQILIGTVPPVKGDDKSKKSGSKTYQPELPLPEMQQLQPAIYAKMVQKVGTKRYWEQWAKDVAGIAERYIKRISALISKRGPHKDAFGSFLKGLQKNINPYVTSDEVIEMLAQHMITKPVFEALFENYSFVKENPVSQSLQKMIDLLEEQALEKDTIILSRFYENVKKSVSNIDNAEARQKIIVELYDKFFKTAFPKTVEKLGIVYTPVEIVDFINQSVADVLQKEFRISLSDENVHILDPFTGTGTFIVRMIESGLINNAALERKYKKELHANEIVLLAYYIASINIENSYYAVMGNDKNYKSFNGICLTDTFQLGEMDDTNWLFAPQLPKNSKRVQKQLQTPIQVIVGNPPYSIGQKNENDNAKNQSYPKLEKSIIKNYIETSNATQSKSLYDSYIKAFRWASDRIGKTGGVIGFVSNAGWLDTQAMDGFRKSLEKEFSSIYVYNLRGNQRTSGEASRKEGGKIFGSGSRTPIAITLLVRKPNWKGKANIYYHDIGDYLTREEKLNIVSKSKSVLNKNIIWELLIPNKYGDWLNQRNDMFNSLIPLGSKNDDTDKTFFLPIYSNGLVTNRDAWCYNFSLKKVSTNISNMIKFYNSERERFDKNKNRKIDFEDFIDTDSSKISWTRALKGKAKKNEVIKFSKNSIRENIYRPFCKQNCYFNKYLNEMIYLLPKIFPEIDSENIVIAVSGTGGNKPHSAFISNTILDLNCLEAGAQCFPLYYYEKKSNRQHSLLDTSSTDGYEKKSAITDFIFNKCRLKYGEKVTREDIFYYVYGLLHSKHYRKAFEADLKKMLPRLPLVSKNDDFWSFSKAGRVLADLHLNYESKKPCSIVKVTGIKSGNFKVVKMRFGKLCDKSDDKSVIEFNNAITLSNIPLEAYEYIVNGRSAIEWVMERYQVKTDTASGIINDPNDWAKEHDKPKYILDLLLRIITVSLESIRIINKLPEVSFK